MMDTLGMVISIVCVLATGIGAGAGWMRGRCLRREIVEADERDARWLASHSARIRRQVLDAVKDLKGRDLPPLAAAAIVLKHLGVK